MRETIRSLSIYLTFCGVIGTAANVAGLAVGVDSAIAVSLGIARLVAAMGLLYAGLRLRHLLGHQPNHVLAILHFNIGLVAILLVLTVVAGEPGLIAAQLGFGLLLLWYIRTNVKRLASDEAAAITAIAA